MLTSNMDNRWCLIDHWQVSSRKLLKFTNNRGQTPKDLPISTKGRTLSSLLPTTSWVAKEVSKTMDSSQTHITQIRSIQSIFSLLTHFQLTKVTTPTSLQTIHRLKTTHQLRIQELCLEEATRTIKHLMASSPETRGNRVSPRRGHKTHLWTRSLFYPLLWSTNHPRKAKLANSASNQGLKSTHLQFIRTWGLW
jgi:hypothetical protein